MQIEMAPEKTFDEVNDVVDPQSINAQRVRDRSTNEKLKRATEDAY
mgnify:CR=1 FL=1